MKRFILKTLLFIIPVIILFISVEFLLRQIPNDYCYKKNYLDKHASDIQILILGNSHIFYGINPVYFSQNSFNAGHISQSLDIDFEIFKKYRENFNELKMIVLPISYFSLWAKLENSDEYWRMKNYVLYYGLKGKSLKYYSELLCNSAGTSIKLFNQYYLKHKDNITCNNLGWGMTYRFTDDAMDLEQSGKARAQIQNKIITSSGSEKLFIENCETLNKFADYCNQNNIKLLFLSIPVYPSFLENIDKEKLNRVVETLNNIVAKHRGCYYFNWLEDEDFVREDFFDADHLNEIGAEKLSKKFAGSIDSLN